MHYFYMANFGYVIILVYFWWIAMSISNHLYENTVKRFLCITNIGNFLILLILYLNYTVNLDFLGKTEFFFCHLFYVVPFIVGAIPIKKTSEIKKLVGLEKVNVILAWVNLLFFFYSYITVICANI